MQTFGDAADHKQMRKECIVRGGSFGIGRVYDVLAIPLLDELDPTDDGYDGMLELLRTFFEAVVRILKNWQKGGGKKAPASKAGPQAASSNTRNTRSQSRNQ
ncbi:hypothetical protein C8F01DRAFT_1188537 [Mycena amicta]|nr:hypothetical protein C8F01DRAFT_1188537 [Mycena amicta]